MEEKILRSIRSAGGWFVGRYAACVMENYDNLQSDKSYKDEFVKVVFNQHGRDSEYSGTRIRVNALLRIIENNKIIEALEYIINSQRIKTDDPQAVEIAKETLAKLRYK